MLSIIVPCKNEEEATVINNKLKNEDIFVNNITDSDTQYNGGICTITSYLAKGLEFDSVIISDSNRYSENILDTKLLYVACTRAMHTLDIISK